MELLLLKLNRGRVSKAVKPCSSVGPFVQSASPLTSARSQLSLSAPQCAPTDVRCPLEREGAALGFGTPRGFAQGVFLGRTPGFGRLPRRSKYEGESIGTADGSRGARLAFSFSRG